MNTYWKWLYGIAGSLAIAGLGWAQEPPPKAAEKALTIDTINAQPGLLGQAPEGLQWSPDGSRVSFILRDESGEHAQLWYVDPTFGKREVLVNSDKLSALAPPATHIKDEREKERRSRYAVPGYHWSPDSRHLLFDAIGQLWLYSLNTGTGTQITASTDPLGDPKVSPDGKSISYIRKHNLCAHSLSGDHEIVLTREEDNDYLNGEVDWVYAEELGVRSNYFWSPNGKQIVFLQMDENKVPAYPITDLIPLHPSLDMQKYPKPGDANPAVRMGITSSDRGHVKWISLDSGGNKFDHDSYVPRFGWLRDGLLYAEVLNRAQDRLDLYFIDANSGRGRIVLTEKSDTWVNVNDDFHLLKSGDGFIWSSWRDGHTHLYLYSFNKQQPFSSDARLERQLTSGDYEVSSLQAVDDRGAGAGTVYFQANQGDDRQKHLYQVGLNGGQFARVSEGEGWHSASFSSDNFHYVDSYSALTKVPRLSVCVPKIHCVKFWEAHELKDYNLLSPQFVDFKSDDGVLLRGLLLLPTPGAAGAKVPLVMNPYGGPEAQSVKNSWGAISLFDQIMARSGIAILKVDNHGMAGRGKQYAAAVRRNLGETEFKDQLGALQQALDRFPQLDSSRLGWWGWSYGGYMTLYAMTHSDKFKVGVAVAPVTDWHDYDSIYTERYMGLPRQNEEGYTRSAPLNFADKLHGHLLLVHGTSDDNVHPQNTFQMVQALITAGKQFDLMLYPQKTHGIAGPAARTHLYTRVQQLFTSELLGQKPEAK